MKKKLYKVLLVIHNIYYFSLIKLGILYAIKVAITNFLSEFNYLPKVPVSILMFQIFHLIDSITTSKKCYLI